MKRNNFSLAIFSIVVVLMIGAVVGALYMGSLPDEPKEKRSAELMELRVTNLGDDIATVVWKSSVPTKSKVRLSETIEGLKNGNYEEYYDDRGDVELESHHVTLNDLEKGMQYYYWRDDGTGEVKDEDIRTFATFSSDVVVEDTPDMIYGTLVDEDGSPVKDAVVLVSILNPDAQRVSRYGSTYTNNDGKWAFNLTMLRDVTGSPVYISADLNQELVSFYTSSEYDDTVYYAIDPEEDRPTGDLVLTKAHTSKERKEYPLAATSTDKVLGISDSRREADVLGAESCTTDDGRVGTWQCPITTCPADHPTGPDEWCKCWNGGDSINFSKCVPNESGDSHEDNDSSTGNDNDTGGVAVSESLWNSPGIYCINNNLYMCSTRTTCGMYKQCSNGCTPKRADVADTCNTNDNSNDDNSNDDEKDKDEEFELGNGAIDASEFTGGGLYCYHGSVWYINEDNKPVSISDDCASRGVVCEMNDKTEPSYCDDKSKVEENDKEDNGGEDWDWDKPGRYCYDGDIWNIGYIGNPGMATGDELIPKQKVKECGYAKCEMNENNLPVCSNSTPKWEYEGTGDDYGQSEDVPDIPDDLENVQSDEVWDGAGEYCYNGDIWVFDSNKVPVRKKMSCDDEGCVMNSKGNPSYCKNRKSVANTNVQEGRNVGSDCMNYDYRAIVMVSLNKCVRCDGKAFTNGYSGNGIEGEVECPVLITDSSTKPGLALKIYNNSRPFKDSDLKVVKEIHFKLSEAWKKETAEYLRQRGVSEEDIQAVINDKAQKIDKIVIHWTGPDKYGNTPSPQAIANGFMSAQIKDYGKPGNPTIPVSEYEQYMKEGNPVKVEPGVCSNDIVGEDGSILSLRDPGLSCVQASNPYAVEGTFSVEMTGTGGGESDPWSTITEEQIEAVVKRLEYLQDNGYTDLNEAEIGSHKYFAEVWNGNSTGKVDVNNDLMKEIEDRLIEDGYLDPENAKFQPKDSDQSEDDQEGDTSSLIRRFLSFVTRTSVKAQDQDVSDLPKDDFQGAGMYKVKLGGGKTPRYQYVYIEDIKDLFSILGEEVEVVYNGEPSKVRLADLDVDLEKIESVVKYQLKEGWNLVSFPLTDNGEFLMASDIVNAIKGENELNMLDGTVHIVSYTEGVATAYTARNDAIYGNDFQLVPGRGYFVKVNSDIEIPVSGNQVNKLKKISLAGGWNLLGLDFSSGIVRSSDIMRELLDSGIKPKSIATYRNGKYQTQVYTKGKEFGTSFELTPKDGFFLETEESGVWNRE